MYQKIKNNNLFKNKFLNLKKIPNIKYGVKMK